LPCHKRLPGSLAEQQEETGLESIRVDNETRFPLFVERCPARTALLILGRKLRPEEHWQARGTPISSCHKAAG
jgi:hypothetical protein